MHSRITIPVDSFRETSHISRLNYVSCIDGERCTQAWNSVSVRTISHLGVRDDSTSTAML